jgi:hypothetical protein
MYCFSFSSNLLTPNLNKLGDQLALVSTIKQHVPSLGDILKLGVDDLLAVLGLDLSRLDPACQVSGSLLGVLQVVDNDESWLLACLLKIRKESTYLGRVDGCKRSRPSS